MLTTSKQKKIRHYQNINLWARHPYLVFEEQFSCTIKFSLCLVWRLFEEQNISKKNISPFQTGPLVLLWFKQLKTSLCSNSACLWSFIFCLDLVQHAMRQETMHVGVYTFKETRDSLQLRFWWPYTKIVIYLPHSLSWKSVKGKKEWGKFHEIRQQRQLLIFQYIEAEHLFGLGLVFLHKICPSFFAREISSICKTFKNHTCVLFALQKKVHSSILQTTKLPRFFNSFKNCCWHFL